MSFWKRNGKCYSHNWQRFVDLVKGKFWWQCTDCGEKRQ